MLEGMHALSFAVLFKESEKINIKRTMVIFIALISAKQWRIIHLAGVKFIRINIADLNFKKPKNYFFEHLYKLK